MLFPSEPSRMAKEKRSLQIEYMAVRKEMQATSSQDEFAKWARLRRKHDKLYEELEKKSTSSSDRIYPPPAAPACYSRPLTYPPEQRFEAVQSQYNTIINALRFLLTRAPQYVIPFWFSREPMFWLPKNLFPYYVEWFLSLPKAPLGSVSIGTWQVACSIAIKFIYDVLVVAALMATSVVSSKKKTAVKVPAVSEKTTEKQEEKETAEEKKEL